MQTIFPKSPMPDPHRQREPTLDELARTLGYVGSPIYTDDIPTTVPDAPIIPIDPEELGLRLVLVELEIERLRTIIEGLTVLHLPGRHHGQ